MTSDEAHKGIDWLNGGRSRIDDPCSQSNLVLLNSTSHLPEAGAEQSPEQSINFINFTDDVENDKLNTLLTILRFKEHNVAALAEKNPNFGFSLLRSQTLVIFYPIQHSNTPNY
ncbi:hypothetical protein IEQ34_022024 [Dendrobium chrysotoxum]|uniref:Uncharacterized protein n=1 Tax=Dendrobium chrysotoxum TaxID=161865 RepID=A0AAV7FWL9_DENCH|nr:hypothetical protein IEQ34_022024 [Dendrobium chrysotoxum]